MDVGRGEVVEAAARGARRLVGGHDAPVAVHGRRPGHRPRRPDGALPEQPRRRRLRRRVRGDGRALAELGFRVRVLAARGDAIGARARHRRRAPAAPAPGCFDHDGRLVGRGEHPIEIWSPATGPRRAVVGRHLAGRRRGHARGASRAAACGPSAVAGIGFDATCSLVALDAAGRPVTVSPTGDDERNVIVWMDHRAIDDARAINATGHPVLQYVGGAISPEMETPKLRWLKRNLPDTWAARPRLVRPRRLPDVPRDGRRRRARCARPCASGRTSATSDAGIRRTSRRSDSATSPPTASRASARHVRAPGEPAGGLTDAAAADARPGAGHAGRRCRSSTRTRARSACSARPASAPPRPPARPDRRHVGVSPRVVERAHDVAGVWGPYWDVVAPGHVVHGGRHLGVGRVPRSRARVASCVGPRSAPIRSPTLDAVLARTRHRRRRHAAHPDRHWQPSVLGNRSPLADPGLTGGDGRTPTARRHRGPRVLVSRRAAGARVRVTTHHRGARRRRAGRSTSSSRAADRAATPSWLQAHADALGVPVAVPAEPDAVLLGAAMLGATAAGCHASLTARHGHDDPPRVDGAARTPSTPTTTTRSTRSTAACSTTARPTGHSCADRSRFRRPSATATVAICRQNRQCGESMVTGLDSPAWMARQTRSGVKGGSRWRMPYGASASTTAFHTAAVEPVVPDSPIPLAPSGFLGVGRLGVDTAKRGQLRRARHRVVDEGRGQRVAVVVVATCSNNVWATPWAMPPCTCPAASIGLMTRPQSSTAT